jgi:hypothetical protein
MDSCKPCDPAGLLIVENRAAMPSLVELLAQESFVDKLEQHRQIFHTVSTRSHY